MKYIPEQAGGSAISSMYSGGFLKLISCSGKSSNNSSLGGSDSGSGSSERKN